MYHGYIPGAIWLQVIRDGKPQLVSTVPLADWYDTAARAISYLFVSPQRDTFLYSLLCDHRHKFREVSLCQGIIIIKLFL